MMFFIKVPFASKINVKLTKLDFRVNGKMRLFFQPKNRSSTTDEHGWTRITKPNAEAQRTRRNAEQKISATLYGLCTSAFCPIRVYPSESAVNMSFTLI